MEKTTEARKADILFCQRHLHRRYSYERGTKIIRRENLTSIYFKRNTTTIRKRSIINDDILLRVKTDVKKENDKNKG